MPIQHRNQSPNPVLVVGIELQGAACERDRLRPLAREVRPARALPGSAGRLLPQGAPLITEPGLELLADTAREQSFEQVTAIELQGIAPPLFAYEARERHGITPCSAGVEAEFLLPPIHERFTAEGGAQGMEHLSELGSGMSLVQLRPEDCHDLVPPAVSARRRECQIGQEREPLGLAKHEAAGALAGYAQLCIAEDPQLDWWAFH
jgi:hypothetical protein